MFNTPVGTQIIAPIIVSAITSISVLFLDKFLFVYFRKKKENLERAYSLHNKWLVFISRHTTRTNEGKERVSNDFSATLLNSRISSYAEIIYLLKVIKSYFLAFGIRSDLNRSIEIAAEIRNNLSNPRFDLAPLKVELSQKLETLLKIQ